MTKFVSFIIGDYISPLGAGWRLKANVLHDSIGFIIDPEDLRYKCGWGETSKQAIAHFLIRNGLH